MATTITPKRMTRMTVWPPGRVWLRPTEQRMKKQATVMTAVSRKGR